MIVRLICNYHMMTGQRHTHTHIYPYSSLSPFANILPLPQFFYYIWIGRYFFTQTSNFMCVSQICISSDYIHRLWSLILNTASVSFATTYPGQSFPFWAVAHVCQHTQAEYTSSFLVNILGKSFHDMSLLWHHTITYFVSKQYTIGLPLEERVTLFAN